VADPLVTLGESVSAVPLTLDVVRLVVSEGLPVSEGDPDLVLECETDRPVVALRGTEALGEEDIEEDRVRV
jgi:hypothetical protein